MLRTVTEKINNLENWRNGYLLFFLYKKIGQVPPAQLYVIYLALIDLMVSIMSWKSYISRAWTSGSGRENAPHHHHHRYNKATSRRGQKFDL